MENGSLIKVKSIAEILAIIGIQNQFWCVFKWPLTTGFTVLGFRSIGYLIEPRHRYCMVSFSKTLYPLCSTSQTQEGSHQTENLLTGT